MKLSKRSLRKIVIQEMAKMRPAGGSDFQTGAIGPLEYKLADAVGRAFEQHELAVGPQAHAGPTWPQEVDMASSELEDALVDSGVLEPLLKLMDAISEKLHNGDFARDTGLM